MLDNKYILISQQVYTCKTKSTDKFWRLILLFSSFTGLIWADVGGPLARGILTVRRYGKRWF
jgi:hypothetical protein